MKMVGKMYGIIVVVNQNNYARSRGLLGRLTTTLLTMMMTNARIHLTVQKKLICGVVLRNSEMMTLMAPPMLLTCVRTHRVMKGT